MKSSIEIARDKTKQADAVLKDRGIARRGDRRASPTLPFADPPSATEASGARDRSSTDADRVRMRAVGEEVVRGWPE